MKLPMSLQGWVLLTGSLDYSHPWRTEGIVLGRISRVGFRPALDSVESLNSSQTQAKELIPRPSLTAKTRLLYFNRTQSRVVTGLLMRRKTTLRRHLYIMRLTDRPLCRKCKAEEETSAHVLCECEALITLRLHYL
jgi:hypothetical protein